MRVRLWLWLGVLAAPTWGSGQEFVLLPPEQVRWIWQEVSGDAAYEHIRYMTQFHRPGGGADGLWQVAEYVAQKAREYGLENIRVIRQPYGSRRPWNARLAELWILEPAPERVASTLQSQLHLADYSASVDTVAELVDVGAGSRAQDYEGREVRGRIVLAHGPLAAVVREAVRMRGALGVVWFPDPTLERNISYPDQINWTRLPTDLPDGTSGTFAFVLSLRQGLQLRARLSRGLLRVRALVDAAYSSTQGDAPWQVMVEAYIRGSEPDLPQDVVLTAHLQEEKYSANDDASGCASLLEIARALNRLIQEGRIPRPRRNLRFWWVTEISSQRQYFADHPEAHRRMWVNLNHDMVGAHQGQDVLRVQNVTRLPATRFHFYNDVVEATLEFVVAANTSELAQQQAGVEGLYPIPHLAHLGSRHRYNAKMIFFHNNTDHMTFNEAPIGVPGVTFTNWPDHYIHTSDDDLWNIDRTQLGRNALAGALIAYAMASVKPENALVYLSETIGRGAERLARNLRLGLLWIAREPNPDEAYWRARWQLDYALERERMAVSSIAQIGPDLEGLVSGALSELERRAAALRAELERAYRVRTGRRGTPPEPALSEAEQALAAMRPVLLGGPREFLEKRAQLPSVPGLHGLMAFETLNAVDGRRTGLDIFRFVAAEAREAGAHYYGSVRPEAVRAYLEGAARTGLIRLEPAGQGRRPTRPSGSSL
ncbi:MAG: M28 family peptidase [Bacteroidetes bacterium]|nr:M28 family peptidase [Rhodothermia bacterium]MCX7906464.1 M28 family peptidase [Bacteroidota bacterium]MDW8284876.1 M28 family peptidase [Bacteroidota bacterium]